MQRQRRRALVALAAVAALVTAAPAADAQSRTVTFGLFPMAALVMPESIFFTADAGPYLKGLRWTGWGTATATATGTYELDCSNGGPDCGTSSAVTDYPATYTLTARAPCPRLGPATTIYRSGTVTVERPASDGPRKFAFSPDYDFCARRPTAGAAGAVIRRFLRRHNGPVSRLSVSCQRSREPTDLTCTAHFNRAGAHEVRYFDVFGRMGRPPQIMQTYRP